MNYTDTVTGTINWIEIDDRWQQVHNYPPRGRLVLIKTKTGTFGLATHDGSQWHIQEYDRKYATVDGVEKWIDVFNI